MGSMSNESIILGTKCRIIRGNGYTVFHVFLSQGIATYICKKNSELRYLHKFRNIANFDKSENGVLHIEQRHIRNINIELTKRCNFRCQHCYLSAGNTKGEIKLEDYKNIIQKIQYYGTPINIRLSGGEPSLHSHIIEICNLTLCVPAISHHTLITNGTLSFESFVSVLESGMHLQISVYGFSLSVYRNFSNSSSKHFEQVLHNLRNCPEKYKSQILLIFYNSSITNQDYESFVEFTERYNYAFKYSRIGLIGRAISSKTYSVYDAHSQEPLEFCTLRQDLCDKDRLNIDVDGNVTPCPYLSRVVEPFGNIHKEGLADILSADRWITFDSYCIDDVPDCRNCPLRYVCTGGCLAETLAFNGSYLHRYPQCHLEDDSNQIHDDALYKVLIKSPGMFEFQKI